jgi:hypothetical protein
LESREVGGGRVVRRTRRVEEVEEVEEVSDDELGR